MTTPTYDRTGRDDYDDYDDYDDQPAADTSRPRRFRWWHGAIVAIIVLGIILGAVLGIRGWANRPATLGRAVANPVVSTTGRTSPAIGENQVAFVVPLNGTTSEVQKGTPTSSITVAASTKYDAATGNSKVVRLRVTGVNGTNPTIVGAIVWDPQADGSLVGTSFAGRPASKADVPGAFGNKAVIQVIVDTGN